MTDLEKNIYNLYIKTLRGSQGQPYRLRKNFDTFEENVNYPKVHKVANLFKSCPHISLDDYFIAPYKVYSLDDDTSVYTLDFYASMKALGCYKRYMEIKELANPDESHQIDFIKSSFQFILKFCLQHNITFDEYLEYKTGFTYEWMKHYADKKISLLCLLEYDKIYDMIVSIESEHRALLLGDLKERFYTIKGAYLKSNRAKLIVKKSIEIVTKQTCLVDKEKKTK